MKISHLVEYIVEEAGFSDMDQKAKNIQKGKGAATDSELRQQRIAQLAANQKARNAAPAGRPMTAPAAQPAPVTAAQPAADQKATVAPTQQTAPAANAQPTAQAAPAAEPTGIIDKFKQGWAKARAGTPAADQKEPASGSTVSSSAELKQIAQIQQEIQLDIADLKKQVAALSAAAAPAAQPAPAETKINNGKNLSEQLAQKVQQQKNKLFKEQFVKGQTGLFVQ